MTGAVGFAMIGFGSGVSFAKPHHPGPHPPGPGVAGQPNPSWHPPRTLNGDDNGSTSDENGTGDDNEGSDEGGRVTGAWSASLAPGHNPFGPPGQVKRMATLNIPGYGMLANPFLNVPPGQWRNINPANINWVPLTAPAGTQPMALTFNATTGQWGVNIDGTFYAYPIQFAAPAPAPTPTPTP